MTGFPASVLRSSSGRVIRCMHTDCGRPAVRIVSYEVPNHRQFKGQTHDCCAVHSRPSDPQLEPPSANRLEIANPPEGPVA